MKWISNKNCILALKACILFKMKMFLFFFGLLLFSGLIAQAPEIAWQRCLGGSGVDNVWSVGPTNDGGLIVAGATESGDGDVTGIYGNADYWVIKLDGSGGVEWQRTYGGFENDVAHSVQQTSDGGYIVAGSSWSDDGDVSQHYGTTNSSDVWLVKLDIYGNIEWEKNYGGTNTDWAYSTQQTADGGYIVAGMTFSDNGDVSGNHGYGTGDYWVFKTDAFGNLEWQKCLGGSDYERAFSVIQTTDGGYAVTGQGFSWDGQLEGCLGGWSYWVVKLDASGEIEWKRCYGGSAWDHAYTILQTSDGGFIVSGNTESNDMDVSGNHGGSDYWVVKLDHTGNIEWQKCYGGSSNEGGGIIKSVVITNIDDEGYFVTGWSQSTDGDVTENIGNSDIWLLRINLSGDIIWEKSIGGTAPERPVAVCMTTDGDYAVAGFTYSDDGDVSGNHGNGDYWIVKLHRELSVEDMNPKYVSVYPNPVKDELNITSGLPIKEVSVYNLAGQRLKDLKFKTTEGKINTSSLTVGVYLFSITLENGQIEIFRIIKQ